MEIHAFDENVKLQISKVIEYANLNIYSMDDLLDMKNGQMDVPGSNPEHLVLVPFGCWICYYLVDHPNRGMCHYFQIKPNATGKLPEMPDMEQILKEFGIESPLLDKHITIDKLLEETNIILPIVT
jgi:hypothetical protein